MKRVALSIVTIATLFSCGQSQETQAELASRNLRRWHRAFASGDLPEVRRLLTRESRAHMHGLPSAQSKQGHTLEILGQRIEGFRCEIDVRDSSPNAQFEHGIFVLLRENGEWRVDLTETAGANSREVALPGNRYRLRQLPMSDAQKAEIRRRAAQMDRERGTAPASAQRSQQR